MHIAEFRAKLYLKRPNEGGRERPVLSGRIFPLRYAPDRSSLFDAKLLFEGKKEICPGEELAVRVIPAQPQMLSDWLEPGVQFELWDGKTIGLGTVINVTRVA